MFEATRHIPLSPQPWNAEEVGQEIEEIVSDAVARFEVEGFWPAHPDDDDIDDGNSSLYLGATGVIWALENLSRSNDTLHDFDLKNAASAVLVAAREDRWELGEYGEHASLHFGEFPALLLSMGLMPDAETADAIYSRAQDNNKLPVRELMWGLPGSMLACVFMNEMTSEARWRELYVFQATRLLAELKECEFGMLWTQELYGSKQPFLGAVHGYAGNMAALFRGWAWLNDDQHKQIVDGVPRTLIINAVSSEFGMQWQPVAGMTDPLRLCQHCHGAPGIVTVFADAPFSTPTLERLLIAGGALTWRAGPLAKGSNLCHGTSGNGYAFLKLYRRTGDPLWIDRAQAFAMTAIRQCREAREHYGRGRYSLWTGDLGLAVYLRDCLRRDPHFPTVDVF